MRGDTLFLRLPPRALVTDGLLSAKIAFCILTSKDKIELQGAERLRDLERYARSAQSVIVLAAAVDVNIIFAALPAIGARKLNLALPYLVDEYLLADVACSVMLVGHRKNMDRDGRRSISIMQSAWLDEIGQTLAAIGARKFRLIPAQTCLLPGQRASFASSVIMQHEQGLEVICKVDGGQQGAWLTPLMPPDASIRQCLDYLDLSVRESVHLYVPPAFLDQLSTPDRPDITIQEYTWPYWIAAARTCLQTKSYDFSKKLKRHANQRWIAAIWLLLAAVLLLNMSLPTFDWWRLSRQSEKIRSSQALTYQQMFPAEPGGGNLLAKMDAKLIKARRANGVLAPDDFLAMSSAWAQAWRETTSTTLNLPLPFLAYENKQFLVRMPEPIQDEALLKNLQKAVKKHGLSLIKDESERLVLTALPEAR